MNKKKTRPARIGREAAYHAYARPIRALARSAAPGRTLPRQARSAKIAEWLGDRRVAADELRRLGQSLQVQGSASRFLNPIRRYFDGLPFRYRRFRRERKSEGRWYVKEGFGG